MRKLKLAVILPIVQFVIASVLLHLAERPPVALYDPTELMICRGLNAPALLFRVWWPPPPRWYPRSLLGVNGSEVPFLLGVIVVRHLVGRALDQQHPPNSLRRHTSAAALLVHVPLLALGGILFYAGLLYSESSLHRVGAVLTWIWAASLVLVSVRGLARAVRMRRLSQRERTNCT